MSLSDDLAPITGHTFRDLRRARAALTHPTYAHEHPGEEHYERLEFLGDSVVNLCAAVLLAERHPGADEGTLTRMRRSFIQTKALGEVGEAMGLEPLMRLGVGESRNTNRTARLNRLGNAVEALFGALLLDADFETCLAMARRHLDEAIAAQADAHAAGADLTHAKNAFQEWAQERGREHSYWVVSQEGPSHQPTFTVAAQIDGEPIAEGTGTSKKAAEKHAAHLALRILTEKGRPS